MVDNISGLPGGGSSAEGLFRVKALDRDARGGSGGGAFERQSRKDKGLPGSEQEEDGLALKPPETVNLPETPRQPVEMRDDAILSENALRTLLPVVTTDPANQTKPDLKVSPPPPSEPEPLSPEDSRRGSHINITA